MGDKIYVPYQEAESEFVEKRSRFIGHIWPVDSEDQAQELIRRVKKQHYDARHNCWCYLLGGAVVRYSDDGEPQGTAGQPMLAVLQRENVTNAVCVVTRYFGGILYLSLSAAGAGEAGGSGRRRHHGRHRLRGGGHPEPVPAGGRSKAASGPAYGVVCRTAASGAGGDPTAPGAPGRNIARRYNMDDNEKRLEILRRTKKRRKQLDITVILAALAVLFLMAGIYLHQAVYYILFVACVLSAVLMIVDLRRTKRQLEEQDRREQEKT